MILSNYVVWKNKVATSITKISIGDKINVLDEDNTITEATVKSIIPLYSSNFTISLSGSPNLTLATNTLLLSPSGLICPVRHSLILCGSNEHRVQLLKDNLTHKRFYDIMIDRDLPVIFQDGYCIKVKAKK
jgi:hypothetical protein